WLPRQITIGLGIAGQSASAIEGAMLAHVEAERQHLEQEINMAREIQTSLLPAKTPQIEGWESAALWRLARQVGGDFYDFWQFHSGAEAGNLGFVIADVSDKGVPAALFMALSRSLVRGAALDGTSPARAMERANRWIMRDSQSFMFVTLFYGILNPNTGELRYTSAGHNPPLLYRAADGSIEQLRTPGIALGVIDDAVLGEAQTTVLPGDVLLCYTDGVTEAVNDAMEEWGVPCLMDTTAETAHGPAEAIVTTINDRLATHTGDRAPFDDVTLVVIKRLGTPAAQTHVPIEQLDLISKPI
nr:serine/threonine-protein phosphatase [Herpetosiphonaceae bacterium]